MSNPRVLNGPACEQLDDIPFRIVDPMKRSRFQSHDLLKLIRIVTRRQTYAAPHGQGEDEWQAVADELNETVEAAFSFRACRDKVAALLTEHKRATSASRQASGIVEKHTGLSDLVEAYPQLKTRFEERQQAEKDKKNRKMKRLTLTHRKNRADEAATTEEGGGQDDINKVQGDAERAGQTEHDERRELWEMLGSAYSSEEEGNKRRRTRTGMPKGRETTK
ncbi:hypothetical protein JG688_00017633 [Phytophthora aleatoria]|uniref:Uncharacterized protein n=1 Tax=Phytophthora aleatoria TaxID=2496075 RepID=A0A8J5I5K0_9STRA|nr:hypothetical protein JG688_00017633 [Phytophthora aleatoria]